MEGFQLVQKKQASHLGIWWIALGAAMWAMSSINWYIKLMTLATGLLLNWLILHQTIDFGQWIGFAIIWMAVLHLSRLRDEPKDYMYLRKPKEQFLKHRIKEVLPRKRVYP